LSTLIDVGGFHLPCSEVARGHSIGFSAWPRKQATDRPIEFNEFNPEFRAEFSLEDARRDIAWLRTTGELNTMKLS